MDSLQIRYLFINDKNTDTLKDVIVSLTLKIQD